MTGSRRRGRILIVGINYAPEYAGNGPYTTGLAERLLSVGYDVTVVAGMPHYPRWRIDRRYAGRMRADEQVGGVHLIRRAHYVPDRQTAARRAALEATFLVNGLTARPMHPDAIIGIVPSLSGALLARMYATRYRVPYGILFQDLVAPAVDQSGISGGRLVAGVTRRLESFGVIGARAVAVVSEAFMPYLTSIGVPRERLVHVPNWTHIAPPAADTTRARRAMRWDIDRHIVLHSGNMGLKQGLEQVIDAAAVAGPNSQLLFVLMGDGSQRDMLVDRARGLPNVVFTPPQPEANFPTVLAAADCLLISERPTVLDMSLPSKLTSYLAAGRPIVAAVNPRGATAAEVERSAAGLVVEAGDAQGLLDALSRLTRDPELARALGSAGYRYAALNLTPEKSYARIDAFVERLVGTRGSARFEVAT